MIKISHVMTIYTIKDYFFFLCMCITSFYTYTTENMLYVIYVLQAK